MSRTLAFPFAVSGNGTVVATGGDDALRGMIVQVLFTAPGERIELPQFGCGLFNLVFEANDDLLGAAMSFTISEALNRWLGDRLVVTGVDVAREGELVVVEVAYTKRRDLTTEAVRIRFQEGSAWTTG